MNSFTVTIPNGGISDDVSYEGLAMTVR